MAVNKQLKQSTTAKSFLNILLSTVDNNNGLEQVETIDLIESATKLVGKAGDTEQGLLGSIVAELGKRNNLDELSMGQLLSFAVVTINKIGQPNENDVNKTDIISNKKLENIKRV
jgi:hypothetical protein